MNTLVGERGLKVTCFLMYHGCTQVADREGGIMARYHERSIPTHPSLGVDSVDFVGIDPTFDRLCVGSGSTCQDDIAHRR